VISPAISLPNADSITLDFDYYFSMRVNANNDDYFRVVVVTAAGANIIYEQLGSPVDVPASWLHITRDLSAFANQSIQLRIEAADAGQPSLIEAGIDTISITVN